MIDRIIRGFGVISLLVVCHVGFSRQLAGDVWREAGAPEIRNFRPTEYPGGGKNYAIAQDSLGLIFVANESGVLVYDGTQWEQISLPGNSPAHALCYAQQKIFVGGYNHIGYVESDSTGGWRFVSLNHLLPDSLKNFKAIGEAIAVDDTVYFRSYYALFRWDGRRLHVFRPRTLFFNAHRAGKTVFVSEWGRGLMQVEGDTLRFAPQGEVFARKIIAGIFAHPGGGWEIVTRFDGRYRVDTRGVYPLPVQNPSFWKNSLIYRAVALPGGFVALATHRRGLAIADRNGRVLQLIDRTAGLRDHTVNFVHRDAQGGLWLALSNGLARVETPAAYTAFDFHGGLDGTVLSIARHQQTLFVGTNLGLFRLRPGIAPRARFEKIAGIRTAVYALVSYNGTLFAGTHRGLYVVENNIARLIPTGGGSTTAVLPASKPAGQVFLGTYQDVRLVQVPAKGAATYRGIVLKSGFVKNLLEFGKEVWVASREGVFRISEDAVSDRLQITRIDSTYGVPSKPEQFFTLNGTLYLLTQREIASFQPDAGRFVPVSG